MEHILNQRIQNVDPAAPYGHQWLRPKYRLVDDPLGVTDEGWLTRQSNDLLDIITILYAGRDADLKELEAAQANMEPDKHRAPDFPDLRDVGWGTPVEQDVNVANRAWWLVEQSKDLLDIIKIVYKGREAEVKNLQSAQAKMKSRDQIERRIALIKATLSEKEPK